MLKTAYSFFFTTQFPVLNRSRSKYGARIQDTAVSFRRDSLRLFCKKQPTVSERCDEREQDQVERQWIRRHRRGYLAGREARKRLPPYREHQGITSLFLFYTFIISFFCHRNCSVMRRPF